MPSYQKEHSECVAVKSAEPPMYAVILLNDDFTTMEFVMEILVRVFQKSEAEAKKIMLSVHRKGKGVCGYYPYELAEMKVETVMQMAKQAGFPLRCTMEEA